MSEPTHEVPRATLIVTRPSYAPTGTSVQETEIRDVEIPNFQGPVAYVKVGGAITKNLGNYNSIKTEVSVMLPAYPTQEEITRVADIASDLVHNILYDEVVNAVDRGNSLDTHLASTFGDQRSA